MIAVLEYVDGFGHDTKVVAIYPTLKIAKKSIGHNFRYQEFEFGEVYFDWYDAKEAYSKKEKIKERLDKGSKLMSYTLVGYTTNRKRKEIKNND